MLGTTSVRRSRASGSLAQVETGVRPISKRIAEKLEVVFKEARQALRQIGRATGKAPRALESVGPPKHPRADRVFGLENQFWPMGPHLGEEAARKARQLEALRPRAEHYWRNLNGVRYDSWTEKLFQVVVGLSGAELTGVSLGSLGCELELRPVSPSLPQVESQASLIRSRGSGDSRPKILRLSSPGAYLVGTPCRQVAPAGNVPQRGEG